MKLAELHSELTHSLCPYSGVSVSSNNYTFDALSYDPTTRLHPVHFLYECIYLQSCVA